MDSIGDILKRLPVSDWQGKVEQNFRELLQHPLVENLLTTHPGIHLDHFRPHMNSLYQAVRDEGNCSHCPGLEVCPNDFAGHRTILEVKPGVQTGEFELLEFKEPCDKLRAKQHDEQLRRRIRSYYVSNSALLRNYSLNEILSIDREREKAVSELIKYIIRSKEHGLQTKGLYMSGPFGTGKTFLMCYLIHEMAKSGYTGAVVYMPDFVEDCKSMIQDSERLKETIELLKHTDLLVFDDLGAENLNPWFRDHIFGAVLNDRMGRKPTFFTSNFDLDSLLGHFSFTNKEGDEEHKGQRLMERIRPYVDKIYVGGTNKRERNL